jgi:hypothetical protein
MYRFLFLLLALSFGASVPALAADEVKKEDQVILDLAAENWVTTQTARVVVTVEAAVSNATAGTARADMTKAVESVTKADWRLTNFNRTQDQTGMERWSAQFEARVNEPQLSGLNDNAKKASKAGMQLSVAAIDFSPTLAEMQTAYGQLRTQIYKDANDQLAALNAAFPGRSYRIETINFTGSNENPGPVPMPMVMRGYGGMKASVMAENAAPALPPMERSEKLTLAARLIFAAAPTPAK